MKLIDLTQLIEEKMSVFPGSPPPEIKQETSIEADGFRVATIKMNYHVGTHLDAPAHVIADGATLDEIPLENFAGGALVFDLPAEGEIDLAWLKAQAGSSTQAEYVILRTGWSRYWGSEAYFNGYPVLTKEAAKWLASFAVKGIGIDAISIDRIDSFDLPIHHILLGKGLLIVENLTRLDEVPRSFDFLALPLHIVGADGSPVRAAALLK